MTVMEFRRNPNNISEVAFDNPLPVSLQLGGGVPTEGLITAGGTISATDGAVTIADLGARDTVLIDVSGTFVATLLIDVMLPSGAWRTLTGTQIITNYLTGAKLGAASLTVPGLYQLGVSGLAAVRVRANPYTSGAAAVILSAVNGNAEVALDQAVQLVTGQSITAVPPVPTAFFYETSTTTPLAQLVRNAACVVENLGVSNPTATPMYVKLFNGSSAPVAGAGNPIRTVKVNPDSDVTIFMTRKRFSAGFGFTVTGAAAKTDTTAIVAGLQISGDYS
jgi:hypothetical protein